MPYDPMMRLRYEIEAAGVPIYSVRDGTPPVVEYDPAATAFQIATGDAIAAGFSMAERDVDSLANLLTAIGGLSAGDRDTLIDIAVARSLQVYPKDAVNAGVAGVDGSVVATLPRP